MSITFNPTDNPVMFAPPEWLTHISSWHEHIPFAMFLVSILKPEIITELGVMNGDSFCSFCQTVKTLNLNSRCYGVDTWQGDQHAGYYQPNDILSVLRQHHDPRYGGFSNLIQSTFDEALRHFNDSSAEKKRLNELVADRDRQIQKLENDIGQREQQIHLLEAERVNLEKAVITTEKALIAFTESRAGKLTQLLWKTRSAISFRARTN
mgnify:FL=1